MSRSAVQRWALSHLDLVDAQRRAEAAFDGKKREEAAARDYVRKNGPVVCEVLNDARRVTVVEEEGFLRAIVSRRGEAVA